MKVPDITEEERTEIFVALRERKEALEKLSKDTDKRSIPIDHIEERLQLYRDRDGHENGARTVVPGLLAIFAGQPELSTEAAQNQTRKVGDPPDLFGGGAETGGGHKPGRKEKDGWKGKSPPDDEVVITPPAPRAPLQLMDRATPSNNENIIDPAGPKVPDAEEVERLRNAVIEGTEADPAREELAAVAAGAQPSGRQIADVRADARDTRMGGADNV